MMTTIGIIVANVVAVLYLLIGYYLDQRKK